jgi:hypothetical protein
MVRDAHRAQVDLRGGRVRSEDVRSRPGRVDGKACPIPLHAVAQSELNALQSDAPQAAPRIDDCQTGGGCAPRRVRG